MAPRMYVPVVVAFLFTLHAPYQSACCLRHRTDASTSTPCRDPSVTPAALDAPPIKQADIESGGSSIGSAVSITEVASWMMSVLEFLSLLPLAQPIHGGAHTTKQEQDSWDEVKHLGVSQEDSAYNVVVRSIFFSFISFLSPANSSNSSSQLTSLAVLFALSPNLNAFLGA